MGFSLTLLADQAAEETDFAVMFVGVETLDSQAWFVEFIPDSVNFDFKTVIWVGVLRAFRFLLDEVPLCRRIIILLGVGRIGQAEDCDQG
ncbi:MAG: hypothetical protein G01um101420_917 [Parcubacteria group bacterium Gr01-1014_20]|nr:MAG: hypothetical protein G01um101420_917 [Parcubacteria group bacterium Gr01-1014_20]